MNIVWVPPSYSTVPLSVLIVPKFVTVLEHCSLPSPLKVTFPPLASKAPLASKVPVLAVKVPLMSVDPVTVVDVAAIA